MNSSSGGGGSGSGGGSNSGIVEKPIDFRFVEKAEHIEKDLFKAIKNQPKLSHYPKPDLSTLILYSNLDQKDGVEIG